MACLFAAMTVLIMWSECTFFIIHPQLSLAARILRSAALGYHYKYIQVSITFLIEKNNLSVLVHSYWIGVLLKYLCLFYCIQIENLSLLSFGSKSSN